MALRRKYLRVVLGISGGVDSSVAGLILKKQGFDVQGIFMRNWDITEETGVCSVDEECKDASVACSLLGIPFREVSFSKDYWNYVFTDVLDHYERGQTPNPDILCNRYIKFNKFVNYAIEILGADAIATGHYAQTSYGKFLEFSDNKKGVHLLKAVDQFKDQTFFLSQVEQDALQKVMFPIGDLTKNKVKKIAHENNLTHVLNKKESTGICFIGKRNFPQFISEFVNKKNGIFRDIDSGKIVGSHSGIHQWTIGQRCRIGGYTDRMYVAKKSTKDQEIYVALGEKHSFLWSQHVTTNQAHWIHSEPDCLNRRKVLKCDFRFQHTHPLVPCRVVKKENGSLIVTLEKPLPALTPGQFAVFYKDNECLGGAKIENSAPNLYSLREFNSVFNLTGT